MVCRPGESGVSWVLGLSTGFGAGYSHFLGRLVSDELPQNDGQDFTGLSTIHLYIVESNRCP